MLLWMAGNILCEFSDLRGACDWVSSFEKRLERFQRVWINVPWGEHHRSYLLSLMSLWECSGMYLLSRVYCSAGCRDAYVYNSASKLLFLLTFRKIYSYLCKGCWRDATLGLFLTLGVVLFVAEVCSVRLWAHSRLCLLLEASVDLTWSSWLALKVLVLPPQSRGHKERMWVVRQSKHHTAELHLDISVLCLCHPPLPVRRLLTLQTSSVTPKKPELRDLLVRLIIQGLQLSSNECQTPLIHLSLHKDPNEAAADVRSMQIQCDIRAIVAATLPFMSAFEPESVSPQDGHVQWIKHRPPCRLQA